jgi:hypothetical protein
VERDGLVDVGRARVDDAGADSGDVVGGGSGDEAHAALVAFEGTLWGGAQPGRESLPGPVGPVPVLERITGSPSDRPDIGRRSRIDAGQRLGGTGWSAGLRRRVEDVKRLRSSRWTLPSRRAEPRSRTGPGDVAA